MRSILKGAFRRTRHLHTIDPRQRAAVGHPEISRPTLDDLEFDGGGPEVGGLSPSFSFDSQRSTATLFGRPHQIGFRTRHPLKSPHCPQRAGEWTRQTRNYDE